MFADHVKSVEPGKGGPDLGYHLWLVWEEALQNTRPGQLLLHLLGACQMGADVRTLHRQRPLHHQTHLPALKNGDRDDDTSKQYTFQVKYTKRFVDVHFIISTFYILLLEIINSIKIVVVIVKLETVA